MIGEYNKSVIITYIGVILSLTGAFAAINGAISVAFLCLIFAGICDLFDGVVARKVKRTESAKQFGIQLDSLADAVSFLAFPAVIAFCVLGTMGFVAVFYVIAGVIRLAWFNIGAKTDERTYYFQGLPVTYSALILPVYYLLSLLLPTVFVNIGFAVLYICMAVAFVLNVKIAKPRGFMYVFFALLAVITSIGIAVMSF